MSKHPTPPVDETTAAPAVATKAPSPTAEKTAAKRPAKATGPAPVKAVPKAAAKPVKPAKAVKSVKAAPAAKPAAATPAAADKPAKLKLVRDSFTIPRSEYLVLDSLKQRLVQLARPAKKSELLRAGIQLLAALPDEALVAAMTAVPAIKTGRPVKAKA